MLRRLTVFPVIALGVATLACQVLSSPTPLPTYTPAPTYTPYPTLTPESQNNGPGGFPFALTIKTFAETDEIEMACTEALGGGWRLADWLDIQAFFQAEGSLDAFLAAMSGQTSFLLSFEGERWYSEQRHYFGEIHEHNLPDGWLSHADIDEHNIDLGSWYGLEAPLLCFLGEELGPAEDSGIDSSSANTTPETPPTFELSYFGTQPCGEWPNYAVFEVESTSIWILQSAHFEIQDTSNNQSAYNGSNDRPFLKEGECPPGDTILPPFNTRYLAANIDEPTEGTEFSAAITLCTEEGAEGECTTEAVDFVFEGEEPTAAPAAEGKLPFVGVWQNQATGATLEFSEDIFLNKFWYKNGYREIYYDILAYDIENGHLDLLTNRVLQAGEEVEYDWEQTQFLSYNIADNTMKMFIGPNPYPNAAAGVSYNRLEEEAQEADSELNEKPSFGLEFAGTHPCGNNPTYAAFWVKNTSQHTFESVSLKIQDSTNGKSMYTGSNDRGFVTEGGCPPGESTLPPGERMQVAAIMRNPDASAEFEATIQLCTQDGVEGDCVTHKVTFTLDQ